MVKSNSGKKKVMEDGTSKEKTKRKPHGESGGQRRERGEKERNRTEEQEHKSKDEQREYKERKAL